MTPTEKRHFEEFQRRSNKALAASFAQTKAAMGHADDPDEHIVIPMARLERTVPRRAKRGTKR